MHFFLHVQIGKEHINHLFVDVSDSLELQWFVELNKTDVYVQRWHMMRLLESEAVFCILFKDLCVEFFLFLLLEVHHSNVEKDCFLAVIVSVKEELLRDSDDLLELVVFLFHHFP